MNKLGLYIHIPYCVRKCGYCSFISGRDFSNVKEYFDALEMEIGGFCGAENVGGYLVDTIFFGGGTPSCVDEKYIENTLKVIYNNFKIDDNVEITVECNPESLNPDKLECYLKSGVNRISLGVQTLNDNLLKTIGRAHDSKKALDALKLIKAAGFKNINCDVMLNLPGQTFNDVLDTVNKLIEFDIRHISAYSLSLEEGTPLFDSGIKPDEDKAADIYGELLEHLNANGFNRYEVSNFCKDDFECRHNLKYWRTLPYVSFGTAAHSCFNGIRRENVNSTGDYILKIQRGLSAFENVQNLSVADMEFEYIICNLRLGNGFNLEEFKKLFKADFLIKYSAQIKKLAPFIDVGENIKIKKDSFYILNSILTEFVP